MSAAISEISGRAKIQAFGRITLQDIRAIADAGVDYISVGELTKRIKAVDSSRSFAPGI